MPIFLGAQNLIPNPSFENSNDITNDSLYISESVFPGTMDWFSPTIPYPVTFTSDTLEQLRGNWNHYKPKDQECYARLITGNSYLTPFGWGKTYLQTRLMDSLYAGCHYHLSFYVLPVAIDYGGDSIITASWCSSNRLGAYFSKQRIHDPDTAAQFVNPSVYTFINSGIVPQVAIPVNTFIMDTTKYSYIEGTFRAQGGERYLTMGNFYSMADTDCKNFRTGQIYSDTSSQISDAWQSVSSIDQLELIAVPPPDSLLASSGDTVLCPGDTLWLEAYSTDSTLGIKWDNGSTGSLRAVTAPGTYWVELDCGCDLTLIDTITVEAAEKLPELDLKDTMICPGQTISYNFPSDFRYRLNGGVTPAVFTLEDSGSYILQVEDGCYSDVYTFAISHRANPALPQLSVRDTSLCGQEEAVYILPGGFQYELNGVEVSSPLIISGQNHYSLYVGNGCESDTTNFVVNDDGCQLKLFVPNAFTPTGDGLNECFRVSVRETDRYEIAIFSRWGQMVYHSTDPSACWDGRYKGRIVSGVFTYTITAGGGESGYVQKKGMVRVLR